MANDNPTPDISALRLLLETFAEEKCEFEIIAPKGSVMPALFRSAVNSLPALLDAAERLAEVEKENEPDIQEFGHEVAEPWKNKPTARAIAEAIADLPASGLIQRVRGVIVRDRITARLPLERQLADLTEANAQLHAIGERQYARVRKLEYAGRALLAALKVHGYPVSDEAWSNTQHGEAMSREAKALHLAATDFARTLLAGGVK